MTHQSIRTRLGAVLTALILAMGLVVGLSPLVGTTSAAPPVVTFFTNNPTTNSTDWGTSVTGLGGAINTNVDFDAHPLGALQSNFYALSDGVTLTPSGDVNQVQFGAGPGQGNTVTPPLSPGEGVHPTSNFLFDGGSPSSLTISFAQPVLGVGLFVIDYYNPSGSNPLTIEAFTGANGTGTSLGSASSVAFNFQRNNLYFMGVSSSGNDIGSIVFTDVNSATGDTTGIDSIQFAPLVNQAPDCSNATPSLDTLWPPNHKFVDITVEGVTDPDGDPVTINIDSVWQDEPTDTLGDGSFTPDATGVGTDTAAVRAERAGTKEVPGDGRVYHIAYTADDGNGGTCSGTVTVGVPHDVKDTAVDGGALYDSTI